MPIPSVCTYGSTFLIGSVTEKTKKTKMNVKSISNANACPTLIPGATAFAPRFPLAISGVHPYVIAEPAIAIENKVNQWQK